jgi:hypothetical protein
MPDTKDRNLQHDPRTPIADDLPDREKRIDAMRPLLDEDRCDDICQKEGERES